MGSSPRQNLTSLTSEILYHLTKHPPFLKIAQFKKYYEKENSQIKLKFMKMLVKLSNKKSFFCSRE